MVCHGEIGFVQLNCYTHCEDLVISTCYVLSVEYNERRQLTLAAEGLTFLIQLVRPSLK